MTGSKGLTIYLDRLTEAVHRSRRWQESWRNFRHTESEKSWWRWCEWCSEGQHAHDGASIQTRGPFERGSGIGCVKEGTNGVLLKDWSFLQHTNDVGETSGPYCCHNTGKTCPSAMTYSTHRWQVLISVIL